MILHGYDGIQKNLHLCCIALLLLDIYSTPPPPLTPHQKHYEEMCILATQSKKIQYIFIQLKQICSYYEYWGLFLYVSFLPMHGDHIGIALLQKCLQMCMQPAAYLYPVPSGKS